MGNGVNNSDLTILLTNTHTLPVGMSCVSPAMLIDKQCGEHGEEVAVALLSELSLLPLSFHCRVTSCLPLAQPSSCLHTTLKPETQLRSCTSCNLPHSQMLIGGDQRCKLMMLGIRLHLHTTDIYPLLSFDTGVTSR